MGLSLESVDKGVTEWGTVIQNSLTKFNAIAKEAVGIVRSTTSAPTQNATAAEKGTAQQKLETKGTTAQQAAAASGGGSGTLIVIGIIVVLLIWKG
jgi:hypothetical protein